MHLPVAAFISSNGRRHLRSWPVNENLCTLEMHRGLPTMDFRHVGMDILGIGSAPFLFTCHTLWFFILHICIFPFVCPFYHGSLPFIYNILDVLVKQTFVLSVGFTLRLPRRRRYITCARCLADSGLVPFLRAPPLIHKHSLRCSAAWRDGGLAVGSCCSVHAVRCVYRRAPSLTHRAFAATARTTHVLPLTAPLRVNRWHYYRVPAHIYCTPPYRSFSAI